MRKYKYATVAYSAWADLALAVFFPVIAVIAVLHFQLNYLAGIILFYGLPALWFVFRDGWKAKKTLWFSLLASVPLAIAIDYIGILNNSWSVPQTIFPMRLGGLMPFEDFIWTFFAALLLVGCYEHFLDRGKKEVVDTHMKYYMAPMALGAVVIMLLAEFRPTALQFNNAYLILGTFGILLPTLVFFFAKPKLFKKYIFPAAYFFLVTLMFEAVSLSLEHWVFSGQYVVAPFSLFGRSFAWEEIVFLCIVTPFFTLSVYEFFDDDRR